MLHAALSLQYNLVLFCVFDIVLALVSAEGRNVAGNSCTCLPGY